jgi:hypothetical protein
MKKFNQTIKVEVEVDMIAEKLLSEFKEDFKHREILTESIIGTALDKGTISYIYNSLNGFSGEINFKVGDVVICSETYHKAYDMVNGEIVEVRKWVPINICKVVEINLYSSEKLCVEFEFLTSEGKMLTTKKWVDHRKCSYLPTAVESVEEFVPAKEDQADIDH